MSKREPTPGGIQEFKSKRPKRDKDGKALKAFDPDELARWDRMQETKRSQKNPNQKMRRCLGSLVPAHDFLSEGPGNRICTDCGNSSIYKGVGYIVGHYSTGSRKGNNQK